MQTLISGLPDLTNPMLSAQPQFPTRSEFATRFRQGKRRPGWSSLGLVIPRDESPFLELRRGPQIETEMRLAEVRSRGNKLNGLRAVPDHAVG